MRRDRFIESSLMTYIKLITLVGETAYNLKSRFPLIIGIIRHFAFEKGRKMREGGEVGEVG